MNLISMQYSPPSCGSVKLLCAVLLVFILHMPHHISHPRQNHFYPDRYLIVWYVEKNILGIRLPSSFLAVLLTVWLIPICCCIVVKVFYTSLCFRLCDLYVEGFFQNKV